MKKKLLSAVLSVTMLVGLLAGCGGTQAPSAPSAPSTPSSPSAPSAPAAPSGETIKVGILGCHTGEYAQYGVAVRNGAMMYIDKVNAEGGINGKLIEPVVYDQKGDSAEAVNAFQRMVSDGITALIGDVLTGNTIAVVGEAYPINMPMITASATAAEVTYDPDTDTVFTNVFRTCFIDPFQGEKMAQYATEVLGAGTAAIIYETGNDYALGLKTAFEAKAAELRLEIVAVEGYATGDKDFRSQLTNILSKNPDVVFCPNYYEDDAMIVTQAREVGISATFLGADGWNSVSKYAAAADLEGSVYCSAYAAGTTPEIIAFEAAYEAAYGKDTLNMFSATAYDAAMVLVNALEIAESQGLTPATEEYKQAVIDAIRDESGGVIGITSAGGYSYDEFNNPIKDAVIIKLENGEEVFSQLF